MKKSHEIDMSRGRLLTKLLRFSLPLILSGELQLTFNAVDLIVVGRFSGQNSLAAVGSNGMLTMFIVNVLMGVGVGVSVLVARYFGAKDTKSLSETVQTSMIIALVGGVAVGLIGIVASKPLLRLLGTPEEVVSLASIYLRIYFSGLPVITLYNFSSAVLRAVGDTRRPLLYLVIGGLLHVGLNLFFVIVCRLDVAGVAFATVLSMVLSCFLTLRCLVRTDADYRLDLRRIRFSGLQCRLLLKIGVPAGIQGSLFSVSNLVVQAALNSFGASVMAGASAAMNIESFIFCAQDSVGQAAIASVSQNMGARQYERTKQAFRDCAGIVLAISFVLSGLCIIFRRQLLGIYTTDATAIEAGSVRILVAQSLFFANGLQNMAAGTVRGHGYGVLPTVTSLLGACAVRIVWVYTAFAAYPTLLVLYLCYPISWAVTAVANVTMYFMIRKKAFAKNEALFTETAMTA